MTPQELDDIWLGLQKAESEGALEGKELVQGSGIWLAQDYHCRRHFLVLLDDNVNWKPITTHGVAIAISDLEVSGQTRSFYADLTCLQESAKSVFSVLTADLADSVMGVAGRLREARLAASLRRWKWFWGVDPDKLSTEDAIGLFGELWFIYRWLGVSADVILAWTGSKPERHDFQWPHLSVEVKATSRSAPVLHTIQSLDQLEDPEQGQLFLFSLQVSQDELARNSLRTVVEGILGELVDEPEAEWVFLKELAERGYTPLSDGVARHKFRVMDENVYEVGRGFPRLVKLSFIEPMPSGIVGVSYLLDTSACEPWKVASSPAMWERVRLSIMSGDEGSMFSS